jgi:hypothetical protein
MSDVINIDGVEHKVEDLTNEQKHYLNQIKSIEGKMQNQRFEFDQLNAARVRFTQIFAQSFETKEEAQAEE